MFLNCSTTAEADIVVCSGAQYVKREVLGPTSLLFWTYLVLYVALVLAAGKLYFPELELGVTRLLVYYSL